MSVEHEQQQSQLFDQQTEHNSDPPWADLELEVPNTRCTASVITFVECVLVELTHEPVGAEYVSSKGREATRTHFIAVDDVGETFRKRHYDTPVGWQETTVSRHVVRDELITRLTRSSPLASDRSFNATVDDPDLFRVKPARDLRLL